MQKFDYYKPQDMSEAFELMKDLQDRALYIAGGTDILNQIKQKALSPQALVSLRHIRELTAIKRQGNVLVGAMTLLREIERNPYLYQEFPVLVQAVRQMANTQIRNVATIGGNIANAAPSADTAPPLLVLEATLHLQGPEGKRQIPVEDFFLGPGENALYPGEILSQIALARPESNEGAAFCKIGRASQDIAMVNAAARVVMNRDFCQKCRLAVGSVAPVPLRLKKIEKMFEGRKITQVMLDQAAREVEQEVSPITDVRSTKEYRRHISGVLIKRSMIRAMENAGL